MFKFKFDRINSAGMWVKPFRIPELPEDPPYEDPPDELPEPPYEEDPPELDPPYPEIQNISVKSPVLFSEQ